MQDYRHAFIEFAIRSDVLRFGRFTLKSGRESPYFFNAGLFNTGAALARLARFYAQAIVDSNVQFDVLFGPAYKGIPLAAATAVSLAVDHDIDTPWCFNRKEAKDHGEGGTIVGAPLNGRVLVIDDVITAGTAIGEAVSIIEYAGAELAAVSIALDRQERGSGTLSAIQEVEKRYAAQVINIATLDDLITYMRADPANAEHLSALEKYRETYGVVKR